MRLRQYLPTRTFELVVHGLDIARPPDCRPGLQRRPADEVLQLAAAAAVHGGRGPELLLALTGRTGLPAGFSVV